MSRRALHLLLAALPLGLAACTDAGSGDAFAREAKTTTADASTTDAAEQVAEWQRELLDLSFRAASDFPLNPHHKDRGRAQEAVVLACLEIDAPELALEYNRDVSNWRRGSGLAEIAYYLIQHDAAHDDRIADLLMEARRIAPTGEEWRRDRVLAKVAKCYALQGKDVLVAEVARNIAPVEASRVTEGFALRTDAAGARRQIEGLEALASTAGFEEVREGLEASIALHDRFYDDEALRAEIEASIQECLAKVPLDLRIQLLFSLADNELDHDNLAHAVELLDQARALRESAHWPAEYGVPLMAGEAARRRLAGQTEEALAGFAAAQASYERDVENGILLDFFRREALVPMAEAYVRAGMSDEALETYRLAVTELSKNANARPRTDDLVATCCSMVAQGIEPDAQLMQAIDTCSESIAATWKRLAAQAAE